MINHGNIKSNIFAPPKEGCEASRQGLVPFHQDNWGDKTKNKDKIFVFRPQNDDLEMINNKGFNFVIKNLIADIIQLDIRRGNQSIRK